MLKEDISYSLEELNDSVSTKDIVLFQTEEDNVDLNTNLQI